jgi:hypothetical protein
MRSGQVCFAEGTPDWDAAEARVSELLIAGAEFLRRASGAGHARG